MLQRLGMVYEESNKCGLDDSVNAARILIKMLIDRSELRVGS